MNQYFAAAKVARAAEIAARPDLLGPLTVVTLASDAFNISWIADKGGFIAKGAERSFQTKKLMEYLR